MTDIFDGGEDSVVWNEYIKRQGEVERARGAEDGRPRWFETSWLLAECYAYRRMLQASSDSFLLCYELIILPGKSYAIRQQQMMIINMVYMGIPNDRP